MFHALDSAVEHCKFLVILNRNCLKHFRYVPWIVLKSSRHTESAAIQIVRSRNDCVWSKGELWWFLAKEISKRSQQQLTDLQKYISSNYSIWPNSGSTWNIYPFVLFRMMQEWSSLIFARSDNKLSKWENCMSLSSKMRASTHNHQCCTQNSHGLWFRTDKTFSTSFRRIHFRQQRSHKSWSKLCTSLPENSFRNQIKNTLSV